MHRNWLFRVCVCVFDHGIMKLDRSIRSCLSVTSHSIYRIKFIDMAIIQNFSSFISIAIESKMSSRVIGSVSMMIGVCVVVATGWGPPKKCLRLPIRLRWTCLHTTCSYSYFYIFIIIIIKILIIRLARNAIQQTTHASAARRELTLGCCQQTQIFTHTHTHI